jgi:hypothetical protein
MATAAIAVAAAMMLIEKVCAFMLVFLSSFSVIGLVRLFGIECPSAALTHRFNMERSSALTGPNK